MLFHSTIYIYIFLIDEDIVIDCDEFKNEVFQCVFQYLRRFDAKMDLSSFFYSGPSVEGSYSACISTVKRYVLCMFLYLPHTHPLSSYLLFYDIFL